MAEELNLQYQAENQLLRQELLIQRSENEKLLDKIFDLTGVNKPVVSIVGGTLAQTPIVSGVKSWAARRDELEKQSRQKYWEDKMKAEEAKLAKLESEVLENKDASQIS